MKLEKITIVYLRDFFKSDEDYYEFCGLGCIQNHFTWGDCDHSLVSMSRLAGLLVDKRSRSSLTTSTNESIEDILEMSRNLNFPETLFVSL